VAAHNWPIPPSPPPPPNTDSELLPILHTSVSSLPSAPEDISFLYIIGICPWNNELWNNSKFHDFVFKGTVTKLSPLPPRPLINGLNLFRLWHFLWWIFLLVSLLIYFPHSVAKHFFIYIRRLLFFFSSEDCLLIDKELLISLRGDFFTKYFCYAADFCLWFCNLVLSSGSLKFGTIFWGCPSGLSAKISCLCHFKQESPNISCLDIILWQNPPDPRTLIFHQWMDFSFKAPDFQTETQTEKRTFV
jgi:hypothetical protein